ncbi:MAG: hypothetical protein HKN26_09415 [Acidimicrobiales bacterium]|nr:hypothetical protein [Acidimicrobiales bacterium]
MAQLGADVEQMDRLANKFNQEAGTIDGLIRSISSQVSGTWWKGRDADNFRNQWNGTYTQQLRRTAEMLRATSNKVKKQAQQQRATSGG